MPQGACWWCCEHFEGQGVSLPYNKTQGGKFECYGSFCGWPCAKAYMLDAGKDVGYRAASWIATLAKETTGSMVVHKAPPRQMLQRFGGPLGIEEFRRTDAKITELPARMIVTEQQMITTPTHDIVLRRKKPLPRSNPAITMFFKPRG